MIDPDEFWRQRAARETAQEAERARAAAVRQPLQRRRVPCPQCAGRMWELIEHIAKKCSGCGGRGDVEAPL
jgi:uncharacterized protein (DUF983 family)